MKVSVYYNKFCKTCKRNCKKTENKLTDKTAVDSAGRPCKQNSM